MAVLVNIGTLISIEKSRRDEVMLASFGHSVVVVTTSVRFSFLLEPVTGFAACTPSVNPQGPACRPDMLLYWNWAL